MDDDLGGRVHAAAVLADIAVDLDGNRCGDPDRKRVLPRRVGDAPQCFVGDCQERVEARVQLAAAGLPEIDIDHCGCFQT